MRREQLKYKPGNRKLAAVLVGKASSRFLCLPVCSGLCDGIPGHCLLPSAPLLAKHRWLKAQHCLGDVVSVMAREEEQGLQRFFVVPG